MFIFHFFFFLFIIFLVVGLFIVLRIYLTIRRTAGKFRNFANGGFKKAPSEDNGPKYDKKRGVSITDTRSEEERKRKIFPEGVGDFVKYKDVK